MGKVTFRVEEHGGRWMPLGRKDTGEEVWCDGCCIEDKHLAESIARNMEAAYKQGLEDAMRDIIQQAIRITSGRISDTYCLGKSLVGKKDSDILTP